MAETFLSLADVMQRTGLSKTSIWRGQKDGTFPPSYSISLKRVAWKESEIEKWIQERVQKNKVARSSKE